MEYRRRRRRRNNGGGAIKGLITLIMIAGIVYLVAVSDIGTWAENKIIAPVASVFRRDSEPSSITNDPVSDAPRVSGDTVTREVALPTITHYGLQMGVFASLENAEQLADQLTAKGAAGFVIEDASRYRVLAAVYSSETDALSVRDRLRIAGTDCTLHTLASPGIAFSVTASETQTADIEAAFAAYESVMSSLETAITDFDSEQPSVSDGKEAVAGIADALTAAMTPLASEAGEIAVIGQVYSSCQSVVDKLNELIDSEAQTVIAFSSEMKYTHIWITNEYIQLIDRMKSQ